jgi:hypothetical protein
VLFDYVGESPVKAGEIDADDDIRLAFQGQGIKLVEQSPKFPQVF